MARKLRLEYPGATYHVINRGNYRKWIFKEDSAKAAFEDCMLEACGRHGWLLHAYVVMGNHYHLAVETPLGNLASGMQWLQSTFANRFNKLRNERGHLFQGRYKALLVEAGDAFGQVCHYIHLNPARAGIVPLKELPSYRRSSYRLITTPRSRPDFFRADTSLNEAGDLPDTPAGWRNYQRYLEWQGTEGPLEKKAAAGMMSRGWAIGSDEFKADLLRDNPEVDAAAWERSGVVQVREQRWAAELDRLLGDVRPEAREDQRKAAPWKVRVALQMKARTDVSNGWLAEKLDMGSPVYVSKHVGLLKKVKGKA